MVDQDENESGNPGHTHPGAYALLWGGGFIERGKSRVASRLTDFSESEEDLSSDHPEHEGDALDVSPRPCTARSSLPPLPQAIWSIAKW